MQSTFVALLIASFAGNAVAMTAVLGTNVSNLRSCEQNRHQSQQTSYGENKCPCVGIDNLKGYYAAQLDFYHVQYSAETGSSCEAWDSGKHPACRESMPPQWCKQSWCYVDPCNCDIDVLPKMTKTSVTYQGSPAYWSYKTCGGFDFYSSEMSPDACVMQKTEGECSKQSKCAWNGKQCGGKEAVETCNKAKTLDPAVHGEEDCRCIGIGGRGLGKSFMHANKKDMIPYSPDLGSKCHTWEMDYNPACTGDGEKPAWCAAKWCFVDPCKCKTSLPPKSVMGANKRMRFQGKSAYWSYATCGSQDLFTDEMAKDYCVGQKTESACGKMEQCAWDGKQCLGKALVTICKKQQETGIMGMEDPLGAGAHHRNIFAAFIAMMVALVQ